jgi:macrodomain Ter protein organizer (MatP/YcbG family)
MSIEGIEMTEKKKRKRLSIDMDYKMHKDLKIISAHRNCTMRKLVVRALVSYIKNELKFVEK